MSSSKKKSAGPAAARPNGRPARKAGSPVEAARQSLVVPVPPAPATGADPTVPKPAAPGSPVSPPGKTAAPALSSRRAAQVERMRKRQRRERLTWIAITLAVVVVVAAAIVWIITQRPKSAIAGVATYSGLERNHVNGTVAYPQSPPVGGPHSQVWQNCGIYDQPFVSENGVHALEHGAVWITYQPNLPQASVEQLRVQARGKSHVLLSPYTGLSSPVVASAWGLQLKLDSPTDPRLADFIATYQQGPQTPEPGATCSGGLGTPVER